MDILYEKGVILNKAGKVKESFKYFNLVLSFDSGNIPAWVSKGNILIENGDYSMALICFNNAMKYNPKSNEVLFGRARVFLKQEDFDAALECFDNVLKLEPENKIALEGKIQAERFLKYKHRNQEKNISDSEDLININKDLEKKITN